MVCDFLTDQFDGSKKSYSTINSYRSALSSVLLPVDGHPLGEHPIIIRLLKGMFVCRPPQPKYTCTWDVDILLKYLEKWYPLAALTRKQLTLKTVALMALVSAQRSQTLAALNINSMTCFEKEIQFCVMDILKTSRPGRSSIVVSFKAFDENEALCVCRTLKEYIKMTEESRTHLNTSRLFISYGRPFKAVCSSTLSRWLKTVLSLAGINTTIFQGHSFRSASTSKAESMGVSIEMILKTANWASSGTFSKFYQKEICNDKPFATAVLCTSEML